MFALPPLPTWDTMHPLIIHFPIALLLVAPVFVVMGAIRSSSGKPFLMTALILMLLGTGATWIAVPTGEAAAKLAERTPQINVALEHHEELAETTRLLFTSLSLIFAVIVLGPRLLRKDLDRLPATALLTAFLLLYAAGALVLANTAHAGGRLVHQYGVHTLAFGAQASQAPAALSTSYGDDD